MAKASTLSMPEEPQLTAMEGGGRDSADPLSWLGASQQIENMLSDRAQFFALLRNAQSWDEVRSLLGSRGYLPVELEGKIFAVNIEHCLIFDIADCGHSATVFIERLGPLNQ